MKNIIIDINILMDFLFMREGHEKAAEIIKISQNGKIKVFICAHEITTLSYFLDKSIKDKRKIKETLSEIMKRFKVIELAEDILIKALSSKIDDFEDAVIEASAVKKKAEYILTRNIRDFRKSSVSAITPEELLAICKIHT